MRSVKVTITHTFQVPDDVSDQTLWEYFTEEQRTMFHKGFLDWHWAEGTMAQVKCKRTQVDMGKMHQDLTKR